MDHENDAWIKAFLEPLRARSSEVFIQQVMRKVRAFTPEEDWIRWPVFARWAFPALALSITGFMVTMAYTIEPSQTSTDALLIGDQEHGTPTEWLSHPPTEDQILASAIVKP